MTIDIHDGANLCHAGEHVAPDVPPSAAAVQLPAVRNTRLDLPTPSEAAAMIRHVKLPS